MGKDNKSPFKRISTQYTIWEIYREVYISRTIIISVLSPTTQPGISNCAQRIPHLTDGVFSHRLTHRRQPIRERLAGQRFVNLPITSEL